MLFHLAPERPQVTEIPQVATDVLKRRLRFSRQRFQIGAAPLLHQLAATLDVQAVAEIVGQHDLKTRQQVMFEIARQADQLRTHGDAIVNVAIENELAMRAAFICER